MAQHSGLSRSTIGRIWKKFDLKPHLTGCLQDLPRSPAVRLVIDPENLVLLAPVRVVVPAADLLRPDLTGYPFGVLAVGGRRVDVAARFGVPFLVGVVLGPAPRPG